jgi:hypothetical protein
VNEEKLPRTTHTNGGRKRKLINISAKDFFLDEVRQRKFTLKFMAMEEMREKRVGK